LLGRLALRHTRQPGWLKGRAPMKTTVPWLATLADFAIVWAGTALAAPGDEADVRALLGR